MDQELLLLHIEIDGKWSASEFGVTLLSFSDLYNLKLYIELQREFYVTRDQGRILYSQPFPTDDASLHNWSALVASSEQLAVRRITYESPGLVDLLGFGTIISSIVDFSKFWIEHRDSKRSRELDEERKQLENDSLRIKNARAFARGARELGSEVELRQLLQLIDNRQGVLQRAIETGKIRDVALKKPNR